MSLVCTAAGTIHSITSFRLATSTVCGKLVSQPAMSDQYIAVINYDRFRRVTGARGSAVVEALCYKPEGRGIASR
jgi:hypothetical protein